MSDHEDVDIDLAGLSDDDLASQMHDDLYDGLGDEIVDRHRDVLSSVGLPVSYDGRFPALLDAMMRDKKTRGDTLRFVILSDVAHPEMLIGPDPALVAAAYAQVQP